MDNQNCNIPDCVKELSQLKSQIYTLELKLKNLGLENLKDVAYCLNPKIGDTLIYNGSTWVAEKGSRGGGSNVSVESLLPTGNPIAKITVDGEEHTINESNVNVNPLIDEGTSIAEITVNGTKHIIKQAPGGEGNLDNIKVNNITGTVNNKIAEVTVTGNDINVSTFEEPDKTNEELEIESSDKVTEALAKLQKALKDDEQVVTQAFFAIKNSTGFNENLEYQTIDDPNNLLYDVVDLQQADTKLAGYIKGLQDFISDNTFKITVNGVNYQVLKPYGSTQAGVTINTADSASKINNITKMYPAQATVSQPYYSLATILSLANLPDVTIGTSPGTCYTWEESLGVWVMYQYIGPSQTAEDWRNSSNWVKRW